MLRRAGAGLGLLVLLWGILGPSLAFAPAGGVGQVVVSAGEPGCDRLSRLEPIELYVRPPGLTAGWVGTGYRDRESDRVLVPLRRVATPLVQEPFGIHWEEATRTASVQRLGSILSIHLPEGAHLATVAVLNGEVIGADALLCQDRLYISLGLLKVALSLRSRDRDLRSILVEPR